MLTRFLSPRDYGTFVLGQSIVNTLLVVVVLGTPRLIDRYVPFFIARGQPGCAKALVYGVFKIVLLNALVMSLSTYLLSDYFGKSIFNNLQLTYILAIMSLAFPLLAFIQLVSFTFIGFKELRYQGYVEHLAYPAFMLFFAMIALLVGYGLTAWTWMYVFSLLGASGLSSWFFKQHIFNFFKNVRPKSLSVKEMLAFSWPLSLHTFFLIILGQTDSLLIGYFRTPDEVGVYRIYFLLASILAIVHDSIGRIYKPVVSGHTANMEVGAIRGIYQRVSKWSITINTLIAGIFLTLGNTMIEALFPQKYIFAMGCFYILLCGQFVNSALGHQGRSLEAFGRVRLMLFNSLTLVIITLTLGLVLIPRYGIYGAAIANSTGLIVTNFLSYGEIYFLYRINLFEKKHSRVFLALLPLIIVTAYAKFLTAGHAYASYNILLSVGFVMLYFTVFFPIVCDDDDRLLLKRITNRMARIFPWASTKQ